MGESTFHKVTLAHCPAVLQDGARENNTLGSAGNTLPDSNLLLDVSDRVVHVDVCQHDRPPF